MGVGFTQIFSFTIHKNVDNLFRFQLKENGKSNPLDLSSGGTSLTAKLYLLQDDSLAFTKPLTVANEANGEVNLTITAEEANALYEEHYIFSADNFVPKAVYRLFISGIVPINGDITINIPRVYVD